MSNEMMKWEMQEAVLAGEQALQSLYAAREKLGRAKVQMQESRWMMQSDR